MRTVSILIAAAALTLSPVLRAADDAAIDAAVLAPATADLFIQINNIAQLRGDWKVDPLGVYLKRQLPQSDDEAWAKVQKMLDMDADAIVDTYFGETVVIIGRSPAGPETESPLPRNRRRGGGGPRLGDPNAPGVILLKVAAEDQERARTRLNLKPLDKAAGGFSVFHTEDAKGILAFGPQWMALGDARHEEYIRGVLAGIGDEESLAKDSAFEVWSGRLPKGRFATVFARDKASSEYHAVGLKRTGRDLTVHYAGASPQTQRVFSMMAKGAALDFGPAPKQAVAVASINLINREPDPRRTLLVDQWIAPRTFAGDVLPNLTGPFVVMMGQVPADRVKPATDMPAPAVALAVRMGDPAVAADLDRIADSALFLADLAAANRGAPAVARENVQYENHLYHVANIGPMVAAISNRPDRAGMFKLAYGRIGDWYVVASHEVLFQQMLDAVDKPADLLAAQPDVQKMPIEKLDAPIVTGLVRTQQLAAMLMLLEIALSTENPEAAEASLDREPQLPLGRMIRGVRTIGAVLNQHSSITIQAHRGKGSGDFIEARLDFIRSEKPGR